MLTATEALRIGAKHPYDREPCETVDWAHQAARGVLLDLEMRPGIWAALEPFDDIARAEIVQSLADVIRKAAPKSGRGK